jgi:hypothetical protein
MLQFFLVQDPLHTIISCFICAVIKQTFKHRNSMVKYLLWKVFRTKTELFDSDVKNTECSIISHILEKQEMYAHF